VTDYRVASEYGSVGIDHHPIADGRVALSACSGLGDAERTECHPLVELDLVTDDGGFPDDQTGAVIDAKCAPDLRSRMDVYAGPGVGDLRQQARKDTYFEPANLVGDPMDGDLQEAGVG